MDLYTIYCSGRFSPLVYTGFDSDCRCFSILVFLYQKNDIYLFPVNNILFVL